MRVVSPLVAANLLLPIAALAQTPQIVLSTAISKRHDVALHAQGDLVLAADRLYHPARTRDGVPASRMSRSRISRRRPAADR